MSKNLIAYFSATGTTARVAKRLAEATGADIYEIRPQTPYTHADLDWNNTTSRTSIEMHDHASRPAIADKNAPVDSHDVIFLGFPIWWYVAPTIINTFLEAYDFSGKTIILFATSGGSGFGRAVDGLQPSAPKATIREGQVFDPGISASELKQWVKGLKL